VYKFVYLFTCLLNIVTDRRTDGLSTIRKAVGRLVAGSLEDRVNCWTKYGRKGRGLWCVGPDSL